MFTNEKKLKIKGRVNVKDVTKDFNLNQPKQKIIPKENLETNPEQSNKYTIKESTFIPESPNDNHEYNYISKTNDFKLSEEQKKKITQSTKKEFNELADLLSIPSANDAGTFKLDLFKSHLNPNQDDEEDQKEDYINIDIDTNTLKNKYAVCFMMNDEGNKDGDDDLLDLMDKATK